MPLGLGKVWARIVGLKEWDTEVQYLKNVKGDDVPAHGPVSMPDVPGPTQDQTPLDAESRRERYENWEGEDPGH